MQPRSDASRLAIEAERRAAGSVEQYHPHRAGLDQRLKIALTRRSARYARALTMAAACCANSNSVSSSASVKIMAR